MKSTEIILEELKKEGIVVLEEVAEKAVKVFENKIVPRLALEADEAPVKLIASGIMLVAPALDPAIEKALDFNKDGKIGE